MDKVKEMASKATGSSGGSTGGGHTGGSGGNSAVHKGIDTATDKAGLGDKYDSKINKLADGQLKK